jgi:pimeloyl-ACP methyl ester carboxylesterase
MKRRERVADFAERLPTSVTLSMDARSTGCEPKMAVRLARRTREPRGQMSAIARAMAILLGLFGATLTPACAPPYQHVASRQLRSTEGLECPGYLVWNDEPVRDVLLVISGSGNLSNAFVHPSFEDTLNTHRVAYLTYDKPGIRAPFGDPAAVNRDYAVFERYTLGHGMACAVGALRWAREQFGDSARLHVTGHSEGTLVALYAYEATLDEDPALAAQLKTLVLSGLALEPIADIFERQLAELQGGDHIRAAFAACDQSVINDSPFAGTSCAYLEDAAGRPSGRAMFERLATRSLTASFHVVQGEEDLNTPVHHVRALEEWNAETGHLPITFHYVEGGHTGNTAARAEITQLFEAIVEAYRPER